VRTAPDPDPPPSADLDREVRRALGAALVARTGANAAVRVVYPFLPAVARGLDTTLATVAGLTALTSAVGLLGPAVASLTARVGRRAVMLAGLVAGLVGSALLGLAPTVAVAAVGFAVIGLVKPLFDVPMQGWFGARVPYARRGRVLGTTELTWAGGLLASVPVSGWLIGATGSWRVQYAVVAVLLVAGLVAVATLMQPDRPASRERAAMPMTRARGGLLLVALLFTLAAQGTFVVYGAWLEDDLGLDVAGIGVFTLVVVAAELTGEGTVAAIGDRLGLRRSVLVALLVSAAAYAALGLVGSRLAAAVAVVVVWFVAYEITIVSTVPLATELGGPGRDRLLGLLAATFAIGRAAAALVVPRVYEAGGIGATGLLAAGCSVAAAAVVLLLVPDPSRAAALPNG
jgi:MFS transporter, DHA1 family, inner membrane transport protein